jgi:hypothetical protein
MEIIKEYLNLRIRVKKDVSTTDLKKVTYNIKDCGQRILKKYQEKLYLISLIDGSRDTEGSKNLPNAIIVLRLLFWYLSDVPEDFINS